MKVIGVIPARHASSRFPGKPLAPILGTPLVVHAARATAEALGAASTYVATDDERIASVVRDAGFQVAMTTDALTGTDRVWQVAKQVAADVYVSVQGDEPMLASADIAAIAKLKVDGARAVINGAHALAPDEDPKNPNIPKVVASESGRMLYASRAAVPATKGGSTRADAVLKQVCIYGFTGPELEIFGARGRRGALESLEDIEILRFLELDVPVQIYRTSKTSLAVDVPGDVALVEAAMRAAGSRG